MVSQGKKLFLSLEIAWAFNPIGKIALLPNLILLPTSH